MRLHKRGEGYGGASLEADLAKEHSLQSLLKVLDQEFGQNQVDAVEEAVEQFLNYRRTLQMGMETYISGDRMASKRAKQHDPATIISGTA